jgi:hypothetical protein
MSGAAPSVIELRSAMEPLAEAVLEIWVLVSAAMAADDQAVFRKHGEALVSKYRARCHAVGRAGVSPHRDQAISFARSTRCSIAISAGAVTSER